MGLLSSAGGDSDIFLPSPGCFLRRRGGVTTGWRRRGKLNSVSHSPPALTCDPLVSAISFGGGGGEGDGRTERDGRREGWPG